jgi:dTDP-4-dehydrorhamnose reductase
MMQTVLITGANGFVGYYLVQQLLLKNYKVIATGKGESRLSFSHPNFNFRTLDYTNKEAVELIFLQVKPDSIVHCGAISSPDECEQNKEAAFLNNVTGTIHLLSASAKTKSHFIFLSTDFVFNGDKGLYKEDDKREPVNYYGQTKLLAEDEVMNYQYDWSIIRTVLVYGKAVTGKQNFVTNSAKCLHTEQPLKIFEDQVRTPTYVEDLAGSIVAIVEKRAKGVYHIAGDDFRTLYQLAIEIAQYFNLNSAPINPIKEKDLNLPARRPKKTGLDSSKAKKELGFQPLSFADGLRKTFTDSV